MAKANVLKVKETEVQIIGNELVFEKDGIEVRIDRVVGQSDYRAVYEFLKKKGNGVKGSGIYSVGNFNYSLVDQTVNVTNKKGVEIGTFEIEQDLETVKYPHQFVRNLVINFLLTTLE